jgi:hypothetical protein
MATAQHTLERRKPLDALQMASVAFVAAILLHGADHIRQGTGRLTTEVFVGGAVVAMLGFSTLAMTLAHHRRAPLFAAIVGFYTALGVSASHVLPHWSAFSDSYTNQVDADVLSWAAVLTEIGAAIVLGIVATRRLRATRA